MILVTVILEVSVMTVVSVVTVVKEVYTRTVVKVKKTDRVAPLVVHPP